MKRIIIALILGSVLVLNLVTVAAARIADVGRPDAQPDTQTSLTVSDTRESTLSIRLRAIDAVLYPDSLGAEDLWQMPDAQYLVAQADWQFDCD